MDDENGSWRYQLDDENAKRTYGTYNKTTTGASRGQSATGYKSCRGGSGHQSGPRGGRGRGGTDGGRGRGSRPQGMARTKSLTNIHGGFDIAYEGNGLRNANSNRGRGKEGGPRSRGRAGRGRGGFGLRGESRERRNSDTNGSRIDFAPRPGTSSDGRGVYGGRGATRDTGAGRPQRGIGYKILTSWSQTKDSGELLLEMSNKMDAIQELLKSEMREDWYPLCMESFNIAVSCVYYPQKLKNVLEVILSSKFLTDGLMRYLDQKQTLGMNWKNASKFLNSVLNIIREIVKVMPQCAQKCKVPLMILSSMIKTIEPVSTDQRLEESISDLLASIKATQMRMNERLINKGRPASDTDSPPEDFKTLSIIPTASDLFGNEEPFVRAVITKGAYRDQDHYMDIQFRLMREDFIKPLRRALLDYRAYRKDQKFKSTDIRLYYDVHFVGMVYNNGINHVVQFDVKKLKHIKWDFSKRLMNGNLVCLSNDNFQSTLIFATVSFRKTDMLKSGMVNIICHSGLDVILKTSSSDTFIMAETMAYYEAVGPVLTGLQSIVSDLPFKNYIILGENKLKPPSYLLHGVRKYDVSCLMKVPRPTEISVLMNIFWPSAENMSLNPSQRDAAILALTKEISLIQGPPGTGKTYVGLKVMQVLLENQERMARNSRGDHDPILVVCYTNHALDQFLEGILEFCKTGIVRVGGGCSSEVLKPFMLADVKKKNGTGSKQWRESLWSLRNALKYYSQAIEELKKQIDSLTTDILSEDILINCISPEHYIILMSDTSEEKKSKIHQWLNASRKSLIQTLPIMIKLHMRKLVVKCLQLNVYIKKINISNISHAPVVERVKLYILWVRQYQAVLTSNITSARRSTMMMDVQHLSSLLHQSKRPFILTDREIRSAAPLEILEEIRKCMGRHTDHFEDSGRVIEAWVLGLHRDLNGQLDDVEALSKFLIQERNEVDDNDDFDDKEESENLKRHRQLFDEEGDEMKYFKATLNVKQEGTFLLNRVKRLGISEDIADGDNSKNDPQREDAFIPVTRKKPMSFSQVQKFLTDESLRPLNENEEVAIDDLWKLDVRKRLSLYKLWVKRYRDLLVTKIETTIQDHNAKKEELRETKMTEDMILLQKARVVGMTTTGAAKNMLLLEAVGCRIMVVEEAAEVLEAHIVTALNENCKHLILIGDHKQLRPSPTVYEHARDFGLDVSLFERLINNTVPHVTLQEQHRMRESISVIMRHIYPNLKDHISVKSYEDIRGVSKNIFFIQHNEKEECVSDSLSKSNPFEAKYLVRLCKYFLNQGYAPNSMTVLATYAGQVFALKKEMKDQNIKPGVRVTAVDNFQGEENDIILLSLVRSNDNSSVGFLKVENRVCVALSRAKKGMFAIGNINLLASQSDLWKRILQTAEQEQITGGGLPVSCPNHPGNKNILRCPEDFDNCPEGGCTEKCDFRLDCGHICHLICHGYNLEHTGFKCLAPCKMSCGDGHPCKLKCWQECGDCRVKVPKRISACGHTNQFPCYKTPKNTDCPSQCENFLPCGHCCTGTCGKCQEDAKHKECRVPVEYFWPCDHTVQVPCFFKPSENSCPKVCEEILQCGHTCVGKCSDCLQGAVHVACEKKCTKRLPCGHLCQSFCSVPCPPCAHPCPVVCRHSPCSSKHKTRTCGESCVECQEQCRIFCKHKTCEKKCFEKCEGGQCEKRCYRNVRACGHKCSGLCGEICVCEKCETISRYQMSGPGDHPDSDKGVKGELVLKIPSCNHIFYLKEIDRYMASMDKDDSNSFICCPVCSLPVQKCSRYENIFKKRFNRREEEKKKLNDQQVTLSQPQIEQSLRLVQDKDTDLVWFDWRHHATDDVTSSGESQAISSKMKFAYVVNEIKALEDRRPGADDVMKDRISALLRIKKHMSGQQIEEFKRHLRHILIWRYSEVLKIMADSHSVDFSESLGKRWQQVRKDMEEIKPSSDQVQFGVTVLQAVQDTIEYKCTDPTVKAMVLLKKNILTRGLDVLGSDDDKTLCEILGSSTPSTVTSRATQLSLSKKRTTSANATNDLISRRKELSLSKKRSTSANAMKDKSKDESPYSTWTVPRDAMNEYLSRATGPPPIHGEDTDSDDDGYVF